MHEFQPGRRNILSTNELWLSYPEHHDLRGGFGSRTDTWLYLGVRAALVR